jgi:hypothetical protein
MCHRTLLGAATSSGASSVVDGSLCLQGVEASPRHKLPQRLWLRMVLPWLLLLLRYQTGWFHSGFCRCCVQSGCCSVVYRVRLVYRQALKSAAFLTLPFKQAVYVEDLPLHQPDVKLQDSPVANWLSCACCPYLVCTAAVTCRHALRLSSLLSSWCALPLLTRMPQHWVRQ